MGWDRVMKLMIKLSFHCWPDLDPTLPSLWLIGWVSIYKIKSYGALTINKNAVPRIAVTKIDWVNSITAPDWASEIKLLLSTITATLFSVFLNVCDEPVITSIASAAKFHDRILSTRNCLIKFSQIISQFAWIKFTQFKHIHAWHPHAMRV